MKTEIENLVQGSTAQAEEMPMQEGQIFGLREVISLPAAAREYFAQYLRNLADAIESGNRSPSGERKVVAKGTESPCKECNDKCEGKEPCEKLEAFLPSVTAGRGSRENTTEFHVDSLKDYKSTRQLEIFQQYQFCDAPFTDKQWNVIRLYYEQGLSQDQIALATGKKRSRISGLLMRARDLKKKHSEHMREEFLTLRKKQMRNDA